MALTLTVPAPRLNPPACIVPASGGCSQAREALGIVFDINVLAPAAVILHLQRGQLLEQSGAQSLRHCRQEILDARQRLLRSCALAGLLETRANPIDVAGIVGRPAFPPLGLLHNTVSPAQIVRIKCSLRSMVRLPSPGIRSGTAIA
jgi:hypothetical protein